MMVPVHCEWVRWAPRLSLLEAMQAVCSGVGPCEGSGLVTTHQKGVTAQQYRDYRLCRSRRILSREPARAV